MKLLVDKKKKRQGRSRKGEGSLRLKNGMYYYRIADPQNPGKQIEGACGTGDYSKAMEAKAGAILRLRKVPETEQPKASGATVSELLDDYLAAAERKAEYREKSDPDYDADHSLNGVRGCVKRLRSKLGHIVAEQLTTADTDEYRRVREDHENVIFSTTNCELAFLRAALNRGRQNTPPKVSHVPKIWFPSEKSQIRSGFIEREDGLYHEIHAALRDSHKAIFVCGFHVGARSGELRKIKWPMVNFEKRRIEIKASTAKNQEGRWLPIWGDMLEALRWQKEVRDRECPDCPWVFFWHMNSAPPAIPGAQIGPVDKQFKRAVKSINHPDLIFHDLRRSAIMYASQEAEMDSDVVRMMSGHRSESVFRRYNIRGAKQIDKLGIGLDTHLAKTGDKHDLHLVKPELKTA